MYCRSRPQYRSDLGWILGVAFLGTLTQSARLSEASLSFGAAARLPASFPHSLAAPSRIVSRRSRLRAVAFGLRLLPTRSAEDLHLLSRVHAWHTSSRRRGLLLRASHRTGHAGLASGSLDRFVRMARPAALTPVRGC